MLVIVVHEKGNANIFEAYMHANIRLLWKVVVIKCKQRNSGTHDKVSMIIMHAHKLSVLNTMCTCYGMKLCLNARSDAGEYNVHL